MVERVYPSRFHDTRVFMLEVVIMAAGDFFFTPWVLLLITRECHDKFFVDFNFFDGKFPM